MGIWIFCYHLPRLWFHDYDHVVVEPPEGVQAGSRTGAKGEWSVSEGVLFLLLHGV